MEFLAHVRFIWPDSVSPESRKSVLDQEVKAVAELAKKGHFLRAWRAVGRREMWTLWKAKDGDEFHSIVSGLPLWPYMELTVHPLALHPIDPSPPDAR